MNYWSVCRLVIWQDNYLDTSDKPLLFQLVN